jgi:hypothetical protein
LKLTVGISSKRKLCEALACRLEATKPESSAKTRAPKKVPAPPIEKRRKSESREIEDSKENFVPQPLLLPSEKQVAIHHQNNKRKPLGALALSNTIEDYVQIQNHLRDRGDIRSGRHPTKRTRSIESSAWRTRIIHFTSAYLYFHVIFC